MTLHVLGLLSYETSFSRAFLTHIDMVRLRYYFLGTKQYTPTLSLIEMNQSSSETNQINHRQLVKDNSGTFDHFIFYVSKKSCDELGRDCREYTVQYDPSLPPIIDYSQYLECMWAIADVKVWKEPA